MPAAPAAAFELRFRPGCGRWVRIGRFATHAQAVNAIDGKGDWHIREVRTEEPDGPGLFDGQDAAEEHDAEPATA